MIFAFRVRRYPCIFATIRTIGQSGDRMNASVSEKVSKYLSVLQNAFNLQGLQGWSGLRKYTHIYRYTPIYKYIFKKIDSWIVFSGRQYSCGVAGV